MVELLDDVVDDLSVFHRVDDPLALPASRFFRMAERLKFRDGAVRHALLVAQEEMGTAPPGPVPVYVADADEFDRDNAAEVAALAAASQTAGFPGIGYAS